MRAMDPLRVRASLDALEGMFRPSLGDDARAWYEGARTAVTTNEALLARAFAETGRRVGARPSFHRPAPARPRRSRSWPAAAPS